MKDWDCSLSLPVGRHGYRPTHFGAANSTNTVRRLVRRPILDQNPRCHYDCPEGRIALDQLNGALF